MLLRPPALDDMAKNSSSDAEFLLIQGNVLVRLKNRGLRTYAIPDGVTTISDRTFSGCSSLLDLTFPDGLTTIGSEAFSRCTSLVRRHLRPPAHLFGHAHPSSHHWPMSWHQRRPH